MFAPSQPIINKYWIVYTLGAFKCQEWANHDD